MSEKNLYQKFKSGVRQALRRHGVDIIRVPPTDPRAKQASYDASQALPADIAERLRSDHPRLLELSKRYEGLELPMAIQTMWAQEYLDSELDLRYFRGDNVYVWQFRNVGTTARQKYYLYLRDLAARDSQQLLERLGEDGMFGCWTFDYPGWPLLSRDLLDSVNELYFLDRHLDYLSRDDLSVLDIGAGYGRLAYRSIQAAQGLSQYICVDAVPESTFLCEFYLDYRGVMDKALVLPLDELDEKLPSSGIDVAVNIHSFSEMSQTAIDGWISRLAERDVRWLLIVPNDADQLLSMQEDGQRQGFEHILRRYGYQLHVKEPIFQDATMRELTGITDHFFLFQRSAAA